MQLRQKISSAVFLPLVCSKVLLHMNEGEREELMRFYPSLIRKRLAKSKFRVISVLLKGFSVVKYLLINIKFSIYQIATDITVLICNGYKGLC